MKTQPNNSDGLTHLVGHPGTGSADLGWCQLGHQGQLCCVHRALPLTRFIGMEGETEGSQEGEWEGETEGKAIFLKDSRSKGVLLQRAWLEKQELGGINDMPQASPKAS